MEKINWQTKAFHQLNIDDFYDVLYLRTAVFVVEQNCPYQEVDEKDKVAFHLFGKNKLGEIVAVTRVLPKGVSYNEISIGRVAVKQSERGKGIANELLKQSFAFIEKQFGKQNIRISAQQYLKKYYQKHDFKQVGKMYLEDNIPHLEMLFEVKK